MPHVQVTLDELGTSYSLVISVILANRLMISVRSTYYQSEATIANMPTIAFTSEVAYSNNEVTHYSEFQPPLDDEAVEIELDRFKPEHGF
jgi:hypothetical protein